MRTQGAWRSPAISTAGVAELGYRGVEGGTKSPWEIQCPGRPTSLGTLAAAAASSR